MTPRIALRPAIALSAALLVLASLASACIPGRDGGSATPTPGALTIVDAPIESIDILIRESAPPFYTAHIVSGLPSGCAKFHSATITSRFGNTITIAVKNTMPADPNTVCTDIYGYVETNLDLGQGFIPGQTYTLQVNGKSKTFTAQ